MANVKLDWRTVEFPALEVTAWKHLKEFASKETMELLESGDCVYVIRTSRPFAIHYPKKPSPTVYIGRGDAHTRIHSHLNGWISDLRDVVQGLRLQIWLCRPVIQRTGAICKHVEADLIVTHKKMFGDIPVRNRKTEGDRSHHTYTNGSLSSLNLGSGGGYHWALRPMISSGLYKKEM